MKDSEKRDLLEILEILEEVDRNTLDARIVTFGHPDHVRSRPAAPKSA